MSFTIGVHTEMLQIVKIYHAAAPIRLKMFARIPVLNMMAMMLI